MAVAGGPGRAPREAPEPAAPTASAGRFQPLPEASAEPLEPAAALAAVAGVGQRLGTDLDLVTPDPDPAVLRELRGIVERADLQAATLLDEAEGFAVGDPRATALVLACAWARPGGEADARLVEIGAAREQSGAAAEQHALAAVWALALGGRAEGLEELGLRLFREARGEDGRLEFTGLTSVRAWFTLAAIERASPAWNELFEAQLRPRGAGPDRPIRHLWALAVRTDPERWGRAALEAARQGDDRARSGIEELTGARWVPELEALVAAGDDPWRQGSALRALAAIPTERARAAVRDALSGDAVTREQALEALRAWHPAQRGIAGLASAQELARALGSDQDALGALAAGFARAADHFEAARLDPAERAALRDLRSRTP